MSRPKFALYFHTIRHLLFRQIFYRLYYSFGRSVVRRKALAPLGASFARRWDKPWQAPKYAPQSYFGDGKFNFLGEDGHVSSPADWNTPSKSKLWLYNLHYFDDLNADDSALRASKHADLIDRWIAENPPMTGNGWEPYPLSLRVVNWIKWFSSSSSPQLKPEWFSSLCRQAQALSVQVEHHILANHLFANGKALVFAGAYLRGADGDRWLRQGLNILDDEVFEQFLADGGHFERSPMYHAILSRDLCDLVNLAELSRLGELLERLPLWRDVLRRAIVWMEAMNHPDGEIAFFNDSTFGVAPSLANLQEYAEILAIPLTRRRNAQNDPLHLEKSGFVVLNLPEQGKAIFDVGTIGPDYQPGHAHAETLSFELSLFGRRIFVNSGISSYGEGEERLRQRGTAAHNTVVVNGLDSSEVWGGFRVARRARALDLEVERRGDCISVACSHDGYRRLSEKVVHRRRWEYAPGRMTIVDTLYGSFDDAVSVFHLHPDIHAEHISSKKFVLSTQNGEFITIVFSGAADVQLLGSFWYTGFGTASPNRRICAAFGNQVLKTAIEWRR